MRSPGWKKTISILLLFCLFAGVSGIIPAHARDIEELWFSVFDDLVCRADDQMIALPMAASKDYSLVNLKTTIVTIPAQEIYAADPGTCLRKLTLTCDGNYYPCVISKPFLPPEYQELVNVSNVNYLMIANQSDRLVSDDSANGSTVIGDGSMQPYSVYLMAFDPNRDFEMSVTVYSYRNHMQSFVYGYAPQEIWGIQLVGTKQDGGGVYPIASLYGETHSYLYEDVGFYQVSYDRVELPGYILDYFTKESRNYYDGSVWNYHALLDGSVSAAAVPEAYRAFLENKLYLRYGQTFYTEDWQCFTVWDLDDDGIAELLVYNGGEEAQSQVLVFTAPTGDVRYAGAFTCRWPTEGVTCFSGTAGVGVYQYDPGIQLESNCFYTLENGALSVRDLALSNGLSGHYMHWYSPEQFAQLGWEAFRNAPFTLDILDVSITPETDQYINEKAYTLTVDIRDGTPPFTVLYEVSALDEDLKRTTLLNKRYQTNERTSRFQFTPFQMDTDLELAVEAWDLYNTPMSVWEVTIEPAWTRELFFARMIRVMNNVSSPQNLECFRYIEGSGDSSAWFARALELLTGIADPIGTLKGAVDTAVTGADKKEFLQRAAVSMCATEETSRLLSIFNELPGKLKDVKKFASISEPVYLESCASWLAEQAGVSDAAAVKGLGTVFKEYSSGKIQDLEYVLRAHGYSGDVLEDMMVNFHQLKILNVVLKAAEKTAKITKSVKEVYDQMYIAASLDTRQLSIIGTLYDTYYQKLSIGKELEKLAISSDLDRAALIWNSNATLLGLDAAADMADLAAAAKDLKDGGVLAVLDSLLWTIDKGFGVHSVSKAFYQLSMGVELVGVCWGDFLKTRAEFISRPSRETFIRACYSLINYETAAVLANGSYRKMVDAGRQSLAKDLIGFGEPMAESARRVKEDSDRMKEHVKLMRRELALMREAGNDLPEETLTLLNILDPEGTHNPFEGSTGGGIR